MKYVNAAIHVDATGWITLEVPDDWTDEEIKTYALEAYFPTEGSNVEIGDPIEVVGISICTKEQYLEARSEGNAESAIEDKEQEN